MKPALPVAISYSGGASSEWLVEAVIRGVIHRPEHVAVFFADTGEEHLWTYRHVVEVEARAAKAGIEFVRCSRGQSLGDHLLEFAASAGKKTRADFPPLYVLKDGGGVGRVMQRCTREFKVAPLRRAASAWLARLGLPKRVEKWIGFGADEVSRALKAEAKQDVQWESLAFPAVRLGLTRGPNSASSSPSGPVVHRTSACAPSARTRRPRDGARSPKSSVHASTRSTRRCAT